MGLLEFRKRAAFIGAVLGGVSAFSIPIKGLEDTFSSLKEAGSSFEKSTGLFGGGTEIDYSVHRDTIIPSWSTGVVEKHEGKDVVCFEGVCNEEPPRMGGGDPSRIFVPPIGKSAKRDSNRNKEYYKRPNAPFYPSYPNEDSVLASEDVPGGGLQSFPSEFSQPASSRGEGGPEDALGVIFSIGDEDSYLLIANLSLNLPLKSFVSDVSMTAEEVYAKDRKEYLMSELEGKGSMYRFDSGLNVLTSPKMNFYIPKTALSITVHSGRLVYPRTFVSFMKKLFFNTSPFSYVKDIDGSMVYYIPIFNATISLPNPQTPIISQMIVTAEGYGVSASKAKRLEIDKGILVLSATAYRNEDLLRATETLRRFAAGETRNPFKDMADKYNFGEEEVSEEISLSSDQRRASEESSGSSEGSSSSESAKSRRKGSKMANTVEGYLAMAKKWREKAASAKKEKYREFSIKKAEKYESKASKLQQESYNNAIINARSQSASQASSSSSSQASSLSSSQSSDLSSSQASSLSSNMSSSQSSSASVVKGGIISSSSANQVSSSWFSDKSSKNTAIKRVIDSKSEKSSSSQSSDSFSSSTASQSVYESSSIEAIKKAFTSSAASSVISAHQANEVYSSSVSSSEYANREIKQSLMGIAIQNAMFSTNGTMYQSQEYSSHGVKSKKSSKRWLSKRVSEITNMRKWMKTSSEKYKKQNTTKKIAYAATKEQATASAALKYFSKASMMNKSTVAASSMEKKARLQGNTKMARSYRRKSAKMRRFFKEFTKKGNQLAEAARKFRTEKIAECNLQASLAAAKIKNPEMHISQKETQDLQRAVAQILTSSQIQVLSKVLSPMQIRVLTKMLSPMQVQQTLVHIGAMNPEEIQIFLMKLQLKGIELQNLPENNVQFPDLLQSATMPLNNTPCMNRLGKFVALQSPDCLMNASELQKYLLQGQLLFQVKENLLSPLQIEHLKLKATEQSRAIKMLTSQLEAHKKLVEERLRQKMFDSKWGFNASTCNPMFNVQTGGDAGAFDGVVSKGGLLLAGDVFLNDNAYQAIKQLLASPAVSNYVGADPSVISQLVYKNMSKNDLMCLLSKSLMGMPAYSSIPNEERALFNARYGAAQNKLFGLFGNSSSRLEQALNSAFGLIRNSTVKCGGSNVAPFSQTPQACRIAPLMSLQ